MDGNPSMASLMGSFDSKSAVRSPSHTPQLLQNHLYEAFLSGETADISLRVSGSWNATYRLHRIVLTQAGFFRSLFTSGFLEGSPNASVVQGEVRVRFDHDPNITRAAFEICLARLYCGGPPLFVDPALKPTPTEPLTTAYSRPWISRTPVPTDHHPASPQFLLSLLSTAFYLSIPTLASEALHLVLASIGPTTVVRYLNYALGKGIGPSDFAEPERAVTLEHIGHDIDSASVNTARTETIYDSYKLENEGDLQEAKSGEISTSDDLLTYESPEYLYGVVSNKIGESCAAFLCRWGLDLLMKEEEALLATPSKPGHLNNATLVPPSPPSATANKEFVTTPPRIWSLGLSAEWVCGVLSSDEFFVKNEMERYDAAKRVVEMRRKTHGIVDKEDAQWSRLFGEGIYYSHFSWEDLVKVSEDVSPTTNMPYISLATIQAAHWSSDMLKQLILKQDTLRSGRSTNRAPNDDLKGHELGLKVDFSNLSSADTSRKKSLKQFYWPIPSDTSLRIGEPSIASATESSFFSASPPRDQPGRRSVASHNFFGIGNPQRRGDTIQSLSIETTTPNNANRWVGYEPFRFSVEFWGVDSLKEKTRLYSQTVFYAGSCYNVYTQAVRKKGLQLGVYLHRQSNVDPIPAASSPRVPTLQPLQSALSSSVQYESNTNPVPVSPMAVTTARPHSRSIPSSEASSSRGHTPGPASRSPPHRSTTPVTVPRSPRPFHAHSFSSSPQAVTPINSPIPHRSIGLLSNASQQFSPSPAPPSQPYRDPRPAISAYFSIACHSATGSSLTRFSSAPDTFAVSQSWGWKSSSLEVGDSIDEQDTPESSFRATVVIGLV